MLNLQLPSPIQEIYTPLLEEKKVRLFIKREDLIHPVVSGNKWRKLKYNLLTAKEVGHTSILSFGGAYSNHIHALAGASNALGLNSIGIIRGEASFPLNATLAYAQSCGMELHFISREDYKKKTTPEFLTSLEERFGKFYSIPEGGYNTEGRNGCMEITKEITIDYDVLCCACGTGTTLSGIIASLPEGKKAIGFPALKGGAFLYEEINALLLSQNTANWHLETDYHFGGYGKWNHELLDFIADFRETHGIQLDQVYTGKLLFGLVDLIRKDFFKERTSIVALHTGGLQGLSSLK